MQGTNWRGEVERVPALTPEEAAFLRPFFLMMKLAPMKRLEERASTRPLMLSADMPVYHLPPPEAEAVEATSMRPDEAMRLTRGHREEEEEEAWARSALVGAMGRGGARAAAKRSSESEIPFLLSHPLLGGPAGWRMGYRKEDGGFALLACLHSYPSSPGFPPRPVVGSVTGGRFGDAAAAR